MVAPPWQKSIPGWCLREHHDRARVNASRSREHRQLGSGSQGRRAGFLSFDCDDAACASPVEFAAPDTGNRSAQRSGAASLVEATLLERQRASWTDQVTQRGWMTARGRRVGPGPDSFAPGTA